MHAQPENYIITNFVLKGKNRRSYPDMSMYTLLYTHTYSSTMYSSIGKFLKLYVLYSTSPAAGTVEHVSM